MQRGSTIDEIAPESYWDNVPAERATGRRAQEVSLISTEIMQSINPGFIILFTPLVVAFFALAASAQQGTLDTGQDRLGAGHHRRRRH